MKKELIVTVFVVLLSYAILNKFLVDLGIKDSKESKEDSNNFSAASSNKAFELLFKPNRIFEIFNEVPQATKDAIYNAYHWKNYDGMIQDILSFPKFMNDNESLLYGALKQLESMEELSWFVMKFWNYVGDNWFEIGIWYLEDAEKIKVLGDFINEYAEPSNITEIKNILKKLKWKFVTNPK